MLFINNRHLILYTVTQQLAIKYFFNEYFYIFGVLEVIAYIIIMLLLLIYKVINFTLKF